MQNCDMGILYHLGFWNSRLVLQGADLHYF